MTAQQENVGPVVALQTAAQRHVGGTELPAVQAKLPMIGLFTMICSCLLLATAIFLLVFAVPRWEETYAQHFGQDVPRVTRWIFALSHVMCRQVYLVPGSLALFSGLIALPMVWRSPANLLIALCVLALGVGMLAIILASTILPMAGWL